MKKIILVDQTGTSPDTDSLAALWEETHDAEAVRKAFVAQTGQEPRDMTVVEAPDDPAGLPKEEELLRDFDKYCEKQEKVTFVRF